MATMYDSITAASIPADAEVVAGYVDGWWADFVAIQLRFPHLPQVSITTAGKDKAGNWVLAIVCDCENGDATPATAASWAQWMISIGHRPTIYCNTSTHGDVVTALAALGLEFVRDVDWWEAHYDNDPTLSHGSVSKQYQSTDGWDISSTNGTWPAVAPAPGPIPVPPKGDPMVGISPAIVTKDGYQHRAAVIFPGVLVHIWIDQTGKAQHENIAALSDPSGGPISKLTFDGNQVPTVQIIGDQLVIGAQTSLGGTCFEFAQTVGTAGWGALELV